MDKMVEMTERPNGDRCSYTSSKPDRVGEDPREHKIKFKLAPTKMYKLMKYRTIKVQVYNFLERPRTALSIAYHSFVFFIIVTSLMLSILSTVKEFEHDTTVDNTSYVLEYLLLAIFSAEYILRLWSCSSHGTYTGLWGRVKFIRKPYMVIDIIVIVATSVVIRFQGKSDLFNVSMLRFLRFVQVLRILRLDRQRGAFKMVSQVVYEHRQELLTCWYMSFIILVTCSFLVYLAERASTATSGKMENLADGVYWGIISLLTIGYGDIAPQSWVSKLITCVFSLVGTAFFALPAGILGSGFALQVAQQQRQKHFNRRRVPAARLIQACWRRYAGESVRCPATWLPAMAYQAKRKQQSASVKDLSKTPPASPFLPSKKVAAILKRKGNSTGSTISVDGGVELSVDGEVTAAAVPLAVNLRERCQSEGNLVIADTDYIDTNQDTVISLPGKAFWGGQRKKSKVAGEFLVELTMTEKNAIRFLRLLDLVICIRKFREARRPYDVKDVLEQYSSGQMEMFGHIKKLQARLESAIGFRGKGDKDVGKVNVIGRLNSVETKVETLDAKLDLVIRLLRDNKGNLARGLHSTRPSKPDQRSSPRPLARLNIEQRNSLDQVDEHSIKLSDGSPAHSPSSPKSPRLRTPTEKGRSRFKVTLLDTGAKSEDPVDL